VYPAIGDRAAAIRIQILFLSHAPMLADNQACPATRATTQL